jgi:DNA-binding CsgD family transcriptional regulator
VYRRIVPLAAGQVLLERQHELAATRDGLDRAVAGEGALLLLEGSPGVGKTELVREARGAAIQTGVIALEAKGSELERPFAFGIVRQLLEPAIASSPARDDLFTGAAGPAARLFEADDPSLSSFDADFDALHSLYWLIVNLSDRAPVLVSVDDCQWSDLESLRFMAYLSGRIEGLHVAMLLAGRTPDAAAAATASLWAQIASRPDAVALYPRPLSESAAASLTRERLGSHADDEFCRACHTATGGNPLFLRELLGALGSAGVVPSASAAQEVQVVGPAVVARFVLHRVSALGPSASELANAVAVLGDDSELDVAADVAGLTEKAAREAADDLVRADIFARTARLGFVHPIVRAALYEDLAPGERQSRHASAAEALARLGASPERVTAHLLLTTANGDSRRVKTLRSAATAAARQGAPLAAAGRLNRALDESPAEQERAEILADLGRYEVAGMQFETAEEHLRLAVSSTVDLRTRVEAATMLARCAIVSASRSADVTFELLSSLATELAPADAEVSLELRSQLLMLAVCAPQLRPRVSSQLQRLREQAGDHPGFEGVVGVHAALEKLLRGESAEAAAAEIEAALAAGLPPSRASDTAFLAVQTLWLAESYELPLRVLDIALEGARREGQLARQGLIHGHRASIALAQGSLPDAQVEAETGLRLINAQHFAFGQLLSVATVVHLERGDLDAANELVQMGEPLGVGEDRAYLDQYLIARARLRIAQGRAREGVAELLWCGERLEAMGLAWPSEWRARAVPALVSLGEREQAQALACEQLNVARRVGAPGALGMSLRAAAQASDEDESIALLEEAVSILEPSAARLELAHALADLGAALSRTGRRREGRDVERRAIELAGQCGAIALADAARNEFEAGPGRRARIELTGPEALTAAERRVCRQAADGHTNREIAQALFVTEKTVERHLSSAYQKLGIRSRFQLAAAIGDG